MIASHPLRRLAYGISALTLSAITITTPVAHATELESESVSMFGGCGDTFHPTTQGGEAYWRVSCSGSFVTIRGWVQDTSADGQCARVKAYFPTYGWEYSRPACPRGEVQDFSFTHSGDTVLGYLYEYDV